MKTSETNDFKTMVSHLLVVVTLGVLMFSTSLTSADENDCAAIGPYDSVAPLSLNIEEMDIVYSSPELIEIEVDCWHVGHCWKFIAGGCERPICWSECMRKLIAGHG